MSTSDDGRFLRIDEAAYYARVGVAFLRKLIRKKLLRAVYTGRYYVIDRKDLIACMERLKSSDPKFPLKFKPKFGTKKQSGHSPKSE